MTDPVSPVDSPALDLDAARDLADLCSRAGAVCGKGLLAEVERLRTELAQVRERVQEYEAACESEGLPKDAPVSRFVEHHRNNAGMEFAAEIERLRAEVERLRIAEGDAVEALAAAETAAYRAGAERDRLVHAVEALCERSEAVTNGGMSQLPISPVTIRAALAAPAATEETTP